MAIRPGRVFLRALFALLAVAPKLHHYVRLNAIARGDLQWWDYFLQIWNGTSLFPLGPPTLSVFSDASGSFGGGAFIPQREAFQVQWPASWVRVDISVKELVPLVFAAATWGAGWAGHHVSFHVDNMAVVAVIQRRCAKDDLLTHFLRCLCFYGAYFHFEFSAIHIPGACNTAADASSRNNLPLFSSLFPQVTMVPLPLRVLNLILHQQPKWTSPAWIELFRASLLRVSHPPHNPPN